MMGLVGLIEKTTKIIYRHHINSGTAIYTAIQIFKDCLAWKYDEARNNCYLIVTCKYNGEEFNVLIKAAENKIATFGDLGISKVGGLGFSYSFNRIHFLVVLEHDNNRIKSFVNVDGFMCV